MPYGMRVFCAVVGSLVFVVGLASTVDALVARGGDYQGHAAVCGIGLGLLVMAFLRRD